MMRSSNWPARPTNGRPVRSSSAPGASPTKRMSASGCPSPGTALFLDCANMQFVHSLTWEKICWMAMSCVS